MMYLFAAFAGALVVFSMVMNSGIARGIGVFEGVFANFSVGLLTSGLFLAFGYARGLDYSSAGNVFTPWYAYCGGLFGIAIVASSNVVIPRIPVVYSAVLIFLGQIATGLLVDALVAGRFDLFKTLGATLVAGGLVFNARIDARLARADELPVRNGSTTRDEPISTESRA